MSSLTNGGGGGAKGGAGGGANANGTSAAATIKTFRSEVTAIWEMTGDQMETWIRASANDLTPSQLVMPNACAPEAAVSNNNAKAHEQVHLALWKKVKEALDSLKMVPIPRVIKEEDNEEEELEEPSAKRFKTGEQRNKTKKKKPKIPPIRYRRVDPYQLWLHIPLPEKDEEDEDYDEEEELGEDEDVVPDAPGGRIAQVGVAGFINAMSLVQGGYVHSKYAAEPRGEEASKVLVSLESPSIKLTVLQVHRLAVTWHRIIQAKVRQDILITTPLRIQDMLAADLTAQEFASIRKRIYDTVILGKGIHANDNDVDETIATAQAQSGAVLEVEKFKRCPSCGTNDQSAFVMDRKNGDVICSNCGTVVKESLMHEGSQYRKFEGEVDRNHNGDAGNPLYSNSYNMSTSLSGVQQSSGAGVGGWRSGGGGGGRNLETILRNAHDYIELNVSQLGKTDRRTRVGYKDRQKKDAFIQMAHVGDSLSLHEAVVQRAKELFAGFRDDRELVQQFKGVIAACLCESFEQLSTAGKSIMKGDDAAKQKQPTPTSPSSAGPSVEPSSGTNGYSSRAARRNELHHAKLAGKGGFLLDFSEVPLIQEANVSTPVTLGGPKAESSPSAPMAVQNALEEIPASSWDLEHCRSWLLEASRRIAQQWVDERNKGTALAKRIPAGTLGELEGILMEHTFTLCEQLETELQSRSKTDPEIDNANRRIVTPRVNDMNKVGIKWQQKHERGSGGKGGVGGSGAAAAGALERTAGQSLMLKTAKKLGSMLNDSFAGEAIHKELRAVVAKQETKKLQERRTEASRQRLLQMKKKPYLLARVQAEK